MYIYLRKTKFAGIASNAALVSALQQSFANQTQAIQAVAVRVEPGQLTYYTLNTGLPGHGGQGRTRSAYTFNQTQTIQAVKVRVEPGQLTHPTRPRPWRSGSGVTR